MAAFHFSAKVHSRSTGASAVRAAAYRAAEQLHDDRTGRTEDYSRKSDVVGSAILAPEGAPRWVHDREQLWNVVEATERRRDAQVAQEYEINLPRELSEAENWRLVTDFARAHLVSTGRVCDLAMHVGEASDGEAHPHAHVLMPTRVLEEGAFGTKHPDCSWQNFKTQGERLQELRREWCEFARARAAELGVDLGPEWDHRSFASRGIDQEGQPKLGPTAQRMGEQGEAAERTAEILEAQRRNGERLLQDPTIALEALTRQQSTFCGEDLARWIHRHSADDQFAEIHMRALAAAVELGADDRGRARYSTEAMIALEQRMVDTAGTMAAADGHPARSGLIDQTLANSPLSDEQEAAARAIIAGGDLSCLVGYAGAGKSTMLAEVRRVYERQGYQVQGASLSGIAAENLEQGSGIEARTLASLERSWEKGFGQLTDKSVLVIDEAGMIGSRQLVGVLERAHDAGAKVILVGDPEQLQAIEAGAAFRAIAERVGAAELTEVRRQHEEWQRQATKELATGETAAAIERYQAAGCIVRADSDEAARVALVEGWRRAEQTDPDKSRIMLAHTNADVQALNSQAREVRRAAGQLGEDVRLDTNQGARDFATGDRLLFRRNERELGVKNGTLATIEAISDDRLWAVTDDGRRIGVDPTAYRDLDHGYAVTVHKAQGVTVDQAHVLATGGFDRHLAYVAMTRHREQLEVVYSGETFRTPQQLATTLGRERGKDVTLDYSHQEAVVAAAREVLQPVRPDPPPPPVQAQEQAKPPARTAYEEFEAEMERLRARNRERARDRGFDPF